MTQPVLDATTRSRAEPLGAWWAEHSGPLYRYLRFRVPDADTAEDLLGETFVRALGAADRYDPARGPLRAWLLRIAQNLLRDHLRRQGRRLQVPLARLRDLVHDADSPEERLLWEEEVALLTAAVRSLPERDQELVSLRYGSGLSTAEIGEVLGLREPAVRTRLWRALGRLREVLAR